MGAREKSYSGDQTEEGGTSCRTPGREARRGSDLWPSDLVGGEPSRGTSLLTSPASPPPGSQGTGEPVDPFIQVSPLQQRAG